ncbi:HDOD domain-containing protein [Parasulfuritortus cantonensis]|uniref:HDOD domain-containing protein n=1 Tax=Parasulfuritortus cantonensis TaxID=2528202 RepID=A0A4R1BE42_9PROT|nr:HDOD domain-containing protein [Parasulfuritortus cantonensis]TCJ15334.1 HDOD domain-containing protein [Parasulfuritortus cantonensis]
MPHEPTPRLPSFLIRQPLLDAHYRVAGYQFSLRDRIPVEVLPGAADLDQVRDEHLIASIVDLDYQGALGNRLALLDLAPGTLDNPMLGQLPAAKVGVILPGADPDLAPRASRLAEVGLIPVLEDAGDDASVPPPACQWARLDCARYDAPALGERAAYLRRHGIRHLIAGNVGSEESFEVCRKLTFDLCQGDFLARPRAGGLRRLDSGVMQVMDLLNLAREQAPVEKLEAVFKRDATLTYKLLRYINSSANGLIRTIQSIAQALVWLGYEPLYRWLTLLLFSTGRGDGRDDALLRNALVRARLMENLGSGHLAADLHGGLFIVGVLSHLDALLSLPMAHALEPLRLPNPMREALVAGQGPYAPWLALARACEHFDQEAVTSLATAQGLSADEVNLAHVNALIWSESLER